MLADEIRVARGKGGEVALALGVGHGFERMGATCRAGGGGSGGQESVTPLVRTGA